MYGLHPHIVVRIENNYSVHAYLSALPTRGNRSRVGQQMVQFTTFSVLPSFSH